MLPRPERASESDRNRNKHNRNERDIQNINSQFLQLTSCWMIARDENLSSRKESYANEITTRRLSLLSPGFFPFPLFLRLFFPRRRFSFVYIFLSSFLYFCVLAPSRSQSAHAESHTVGRLNTGKE